MAEQDSNKTEGETKSSSGKKGLVIGLGVVVVVLVIGLVVTGGFIESNDVEGQVDKVSKIQGSDGQNASASDVKTAEPVEMKPGNPVVARVGGKAVTREEVFDYAEANMGQAAEQLPKEKLFEIAAGQLVTQMVLLQKAKEAGLDEDPEIQEKIERAKNNMLRTEYLKGEVEDRITEAKLKELYDEQIKKFKGEQEVRARHILVETKDKALSLIEELNNGADFADLAKEHSTGPTQSKGGDLGYFTKGQMVPEFDKAVFAMKKGEYTKEPVKTNFGWHVILVEDLRKQEAPEFEAVKDQLENRLSRLEIQNVLNDLRESSDVELYGINGQEQAN